MKNKLSGCVKKLLVLALGTCTFATANAQDTHLRLGIYGLNHDHISGFFSQMRRAPPMLLVFTNPVKHFGRNTKSALICRILFILMM
jgi:hypothetical protein